MRAGLPALGTQEGRVGEAQEDIAIRIRWVVVNGRHPLKRLTGAAHLVHHQTAVVPFDFDREKQVQYKKLATDLKGKE